MKLLYLECNMGAAGDMLMGALADLLPDKEAFAEKINRLGIPGVHVAFRESVKCGIVGTHAEVTVHGAEEESVEVPAHDPEQHTYEHLHNHEPEPHIHGHSHNHKPEPHVHEHPHSHESEPHVHEHSHNHKPEPHAHEHPHSHEPEPHTHEHHGMAEITSLIEGLELPAEVKEDVKNIYGIIAEAEAAVHGKPVPEIHFHEVGTADALADIIGCAMLIRELGADRIVTSPVNVGYGQVRCAHGILPVPAPATARILEGVPCYAGRMEGELCTPTGAALLKYYTDEFSRMPQMVLGKIGYGMGKKDFPAANCVRAVLGEK